MLNTNINRKIKRLKKNNLFLLRKKHLPIEFYIRRAFKRDYPLLVQFLCFLALVITSQRPFAFQAPAVNDSVGLPSKN